LTELAAEHGFDREQVDQILEGDERGRQRYEAKFDIYKGYFKYEGIVFVCWFAKGLKVTSWIKAPAPLFLGVAQIEKVPVEVPDDQLQPGLQGGMSISAPLQDEWVDQPVTEYPIHLLFYKESEEKEVVSKIGRGFLDEDWQEAQTAVVTGFVNRLKRSGNTYASPGSDTEETDLRQLDVKLENGKIFSKPLNFFSMDPPESVVLQSLNYLDSAAAQRAGHVDYAALNRKDSRKTATEMTVAKQESDQNKATPVALFSEFLRGVFSQAWEIIQSRALQERIPLLRDEGGNNNVAMIGKEYNVLPAGDVDVVARQEKISQMMQDWGVIQNTALATKFLADLMRLKYPDEGEEYATVLENNPSGAQLIMALSTMLQQTLTPEELAALPPEQQQQLQQLQLQVDDYLKGGQ